MRLKPLSEKGRFRRLSEHAGRNVSERRAGPEKGMCGADPAESKGKAAVAAGQR